MKITLERGDSAEVFSPSGGDIGSHLLLIWDSCCGWLANFYFGFSWRHSRADVFCLADRSEGLVYIKPLPNYSNRTHFFLSKYYQARSCRLQVQSGQLPSSVALPFKNHCSQLTWVPVRSNAQVMTTAFGARQLCYLTKSSKVDCQLAAVAVRRPQASLLLGNRMDSYAACCFTNSKPSPPSAMHFLVFGIQQQMGVPH